MGKGMEGHPWKMASDPLGWNPVSWAISLGRGQARFCRQLEATKSPY